MVLVIMVGLYKKLFDGSFLLMAFQPCIHDQ